MAACAATGGRAAIVKASRMSLPTENDRGPAPVSTTAPTSSFVPIWPVSPNRRSLIAVVTASSFPGRSSLR